MANGKVFPWSSANLFKRGSALETNQKRDPQRWTSFCFLFETNQKTTSRPAGTTGANSRLLPHEAEARFHVRQLASGPASDSELLAEFRGQTAAGQNRVTPKFNPGKWKYELKSAVWLFHFDPQPNGALVNRMPPRNFCLIGQM